MTSSNISYTIFVKEEDNCCNKQKQLLQMSITEFYSDSIFTVNQCGFIGYCDDENKVYIGDTSLQNHILKHINPTRNRKIITCVSEACITSIISLV